MMMKRLITAALAVMIVAAVPGVAFAQETGTGDRPATTTADREETRIDRESGWVEKLRARALEAIEKRLGTIADLEAAVERSETVEPDHAGRMLGELRSSAAGLEALAGQIENATDLETLREFVPKIFEDYRIYAVVAPKVHLVLTADAAVNVAGRLDEAADMFGEILSRLAEEGVDVAEAEGWLAEMEALVTSGTGGAGSVPDMVIGLKPSDYPESTATLRAAHGVLTAAGEDLRRAGETAREIVRFIKSVAGGEVGG